MRPEFAHNRVAAHLGTLIPGLIPGLFLSHDLGYNNRQRLPLKESPVWGGDGCALPPEAVMKSSRKSSSSSSSRSAEPAQQATGGETRAQRVERIRREIAAGTYETPEKLEAAIERMMGVLID